MVLVATALSLLYCSCSPQNAGRMVVLQDLTSNQPLFSQPKARITSCRQLRSAGTLFDCILQARFPVGMQESSQAICHGVCRLVCSPVPLQALYASNSISAKFLMMCHMVPPCSTMSTSVHQSSVRQGAGRALNCRATHVPLIHTCPMKPIATCHFRKSSQNGPPMCHLVHRDLG